jgi:hypothetical protein
MHVSTVLVKSGHHEKILQFSKPAENKSGGLLALIAILFSNFLVFETINFSFSPLAMEMTAYLQFYSSCHFAREKVWKECLAFVWIRLNRIQKRDDFLHV